MLEWDELERAVCAGDWCRASEIAEGFVVELRAVRGVVEAFVPDIDTDVTTEVEEAAKGLVEVLAMQPIDEEGVGDAMRRFRRLLL